MQNKALLISVAAIVLVFVAGFGAWYFTGYKDYSQITSYDQCAAAGYPILESYPEQCKLPDGRTFTRKIEGPGPDIVPPSTGPGTLSGYIHVGPTCAVQPAYPTEGCADRPYASAQVTITNKASGAASKTASDAAGNFRISLAAGTYTINVKPSSGRFPSCETKEASVSSGKTVTVDVSCDSGIR